MSVELVFDKDNTIANKYISSQPDADNSGFDLYAPDNIFVPAKSKGFKVNLQVSIAVREHENKESFINSVIKFFCPHYFDRVAFKLYPRSSMGSKTPLRLSNSVGVIDKGYNGNLIACVDNLSNDVFVINQGDRLFQIVKFDGKPFHSVKIIDSHDETKRGSGGFGSSGKN